jgi:ribosomal-protein-alanine N-acetyltransferase
MIVEATVRDSARLAALHARAFVEAWSAEAISDLLGSPGVRAFAAAGGFILVRTVADEAEILTLAVVPEARRAGVGRALVSAASDVAREQGASRLHLEVSKENAAARALYAGLGFREIGRRTRYYADGADALMLSRALA